MDKVYCTTCGEEARVFLKQKYNQSTGKPAYSIWVKCHWAGTIKEVFQSIFKGMGFHTDHCMGYINTTEIPEKYKHVEVE